MIIVSAGNFLAVQWLGLLASTVGGMGSVLGWGTKIPQTMQHGKKKKKSICLSHLNVFQSRFISLEFQVVT